jgi:hypothetical protein
MQLFLDPAPLLARARRWAALLREIEPTVDGARMAEAHLVEHYLARRFASACKVVCLRRRSQRPTDPEQYLIRPQPRSPAAETGSALALVCAYDDARRALKIVALERIAQPEVRDYERIFAGEIALKTSTLRPAYCDNAAVAFLRGIPHADETLRLPTAHWREYLDWRRRLAETKAAESYAYVRSEPRRDGVVRFHLRDDYPQAQLRQRLLDEELYLEPANGAQRITGAFLRVVAPLVAGKGSAGAHAKLAVDLDFGRPSPTTSQLPQTGALRVSIEGELASLEVQANGLLRFTERHSTNPHLSDWLFDIRQARPLATPIVASFGADIALNPEQRDAVAKALASDDLLLLWGPPGTGKTTVIAEICSQFARRGQRVLVSSQANLAVDQALRRLPPLPHVRPLWISTARRREGAAGNATHFLQHWLGAVRDAAQRRARSEKDPCWQRFLGAWTDRLNTADGRIAARADEDCYIRHANVVGATCGETGKPEFVASPRFSSRFDLAIVDEVSKATPPELLLPMLLGKRILLVGDPRQLPPMFRDEAFEEAVENQELTREEVDRFRELVTASLFTAWFQHAPASICCALRRQYRMHPQIMAAVNHFYADQPLLAGDGARELAELKRHGLAPRAPADGAWLRPDQHVVWLDTSVRPAGAAGDERLGSSRFNRFEAEVCARVVQSLFEAAMPAPLNLAVISFYRAQVGVLRDLLRAEPAVRAQLDLSRDVNTVDQFQGSERDVVIVSLVRSGPKLTGEFARDFRRINVACSRARKLLIIVGSVPTFAHSLVEVPGSQRGVTARVPVYGLIHDQLRNHGGALTPAALGFTTKPAHPSHSHEPHRGR